MSDIEYLRIFSDIAGCSHFETRRVSLAPNDYAPPAPPLKTSAPESAATSVFLELPIGWHGDCHSTPVRQRLILMSGECEFESGNGERSIQKAGDVVLLDDTSGRGHQTRVLGSVAVRMAAVHCW